MHVVQLSKELSSTVMHYGSHTTGTAIERLTDEKKLAMKIYSTEFDNWEGTLQFTETIRTNDLVIFVSSRSGFPSFSKRFEQFMDKLPTLLDGNNMITVYPQQPPHPTHLL